MDESTFRDLLAWQAAMDLTIRLLRLTDAWPEQEPPGITAEIRLDVLAIPAAIAAGSLALDPDQPSAGETCGHRLPEARRRLRDLDTRLFLAAGLSLLDEAVRDSLLAQSDGVRDRLDRLIDRIPGVPVTIDPFHLSFSQN